MLEEEETPPEEKPPDALIGTVAIVGFPNVGKSTLVNRLSGTRAAVVHETPGVTRDRKELVCEWNGKRFLLIDTGGVDIADQTPITRSIAEQAREAVEEADLALLVVDARAGITPGDEEVGQILRESHKPVLVLANKIDDPKLDSLSYDLHRLGLGDPIPVSGLHGTGVGDLLDTIVDELEEHGSQGRPELPPDAIRVAILGRPNVGKSSLLNALVGRERVIVSEIPGTTRDSIDTVLVRGDRTFVLVDTAGLRRKRRHRQGIEYYSELRALEAAERADITLVLIDASQGVVDQDLAVADISRKAECSTLVVLSKWDITTVRIEDVRGHLRRRLRQRPAFLAVSAQTGRGLNRLLDNVAELFDRHIVARLHRRAEPRARRVARGPPAAVAQGQEPEPPLRRADPRPAAALPLLRQRPGPRHARLRLLGRERAARALRPRRRPRLDRLRQAVVRFLVVGAGSWGTAFTRVLLDRKHQVVLACHTTEQAEAIASTGRNPRYLTATDLRGVDTTTIADAPGDVDAIVLAVPSTRVRRGRRGPSGRRAGPRPDEGARPGHRRAAVHARARPRRGGPVRTEHGRGDRAGAADGCGDRQRGRLSSPASCSTRSTRPSSARTSTRTSSASSSAPRRRT